MKILKNGKYLAVLLALVLIMGALLMIIPVSADVEPNDDIAGAEAITDFSEVLGDVDMTAGPPGDFYDVYVMSLTAGPTGSSVFMNLTISNWAPPCQLRVLAPTDQGYNFEVVNNTAFADGMVNMNFNASVTGDYYLEIFGGTFDYDGQDGLIHSYLNPGFDTDNDFASATVLADGASGSDVLVPEQDYVDIFKFSTGAGEIVMVNFTGANMGGMTCMLLDASYADASAGKANHQGGFFDVNFTETTASTYYVVINAPDSVLSAAGPYDYTASIKPPAMNAIPEMSAGVVNPAEITSTMEANVTFSVDATDSDGTVDHVNVSCSLWTGQTMLTGSGNTYTGFKVIPAGQTLGKYDVVFWAYDDAGEYNNTPVSESNITVVSGNIGVVSDYTLVAPFEIKVDEDSGNYLLNLTTLVTDEDAINLTYELETSPFVHDNFTVKLENDTWINVSLTENAFNDPIPFNVNVTDTPFWVTFNITVEITGVNDMAMFDKLELIDPSGTAKPFVAGENLTLDVEEDAHYNYTFMATDVEMDDIEFTTNLTGMSNFVLDKNGNLSFDPVQDDVGNLSVWITADDGTDKAVAVVNFTIAGTNDAPGAPGTDVATVEKSLEVTLTITAPTDEDGDTVFTYTIDWGDDGTDTVMEDIDNATFDVVYEYVEDGLYIINVTVEDEAGASNYALADEINISGGASIEWFIMPFAMADKEGDILADVEVEITAASVNFKNEVDVPAAGKSTMTTTYAISGTCSDDVTVIHLYWDMAGIGYTTFYDPNDYTVKTEITPDAGVWSVDYVFEFEYDTPAPVEPVADDDDVEPVEPEYYFLAIAWSEEGFNMDEMLADYSAGDTPVVDDDDDDDGFPIAILAIGIGVGLLFFVIIVVVIIVIVMKKKKPADEEIPPPEGGMEGGPMGPEGAPAAPVYCACGAEIPAGSPTCAMCGQPAPAAPAEAPMDQQVQYDEYGQPIQAPAEQPGMEQPPAPGMEQPAADPAMAPAPGMEQPAADPAAAPAPGMEAAPPADPAVAPAPGMEAAPPADPAAAPAPAEQQPGTPPQQ